MGLKVCLLLSAIFSQALVIPVVSERTLLHLDDEKTYYPPGSSHHRRHKRSSGKSDCATPSKGSSSSSGGSYGAPPSHRSSSGSTSSPPKRGGSYSAPPSDRSSSGSTSSPPTRGGSYSVPPSHRSSSGSTSSSHRRKRSSTPPPTEPISVPSPPSFSTPPLFHGTCDFWRRHPALIWALLGCWGSLANLFGFPTTAFFGGNPTVPQLLANTRTDVYGALLREGTAAYLNSLRWGGFSLTPQQVRAQFRAALASDKAAGDQAQLFSLANKGHGK